MVKTTSFQSAMRDAQQNSKVLSRHINKTWNAAVAAPMFRKEYPRMKKVPGAKGGTKLVAVKDKDGTPVMARRSVRLISGNAYHIACAGAAAAAANEVKAECDTWGIDYPQSTAHPFMLGMPKGTKLMLEQFLSAYVATALLKANRSMKAPEWRPEGGTGDGSKAKHKRLNKDYVRRAFTALNESVQSGPASLRPACVVPLKVLKKGNKDYAPPKDGDKDAAADEAAADAADAE